MTLSPDWKQLAHEALSDKPEQITADASDSTKNNAWVVGVIGVAAPAIAGGFEVLGADPPAAVLFSAGAIFTASVLAMAFLIAMDFRTRGLVTVARFEALTVLAQLPDSEEKAKETSDSPSSGGFAAAGTVRAGDQDLQLLGIARNDEDTEFLVASTNGGPKWLSSSDVDRVTATSVASNGSPASDGGAAVMATLATALKTAAESKAAEKKAKKKGG